MSQRRSIKTIEFGDFQTPLELAERCCAVIRADFGSVATVLEPTCGKGAFVVAAARAFKSARILGFEINASRAAEASAKSQRLGHSIHQVDFFAHDWMAQRDTLAGPVLFLGNPPWVTNSQLGSLSSGNLPKKSNVQKARGIDAMMGRSNFDISESILQTLIKVMRSGDSLAMLIKTSTARKVLKFGWSNDLCFDRAIMRSIDAKRDFNVSVDACLLSLRRGEPNDSAQICFRSSGLTEPPDQVAMGWCERKLVADPSQARATGHLQSSLETGGALRWRSGAKHDVSRVLELTQQGGSLWTQAGEKVDIERSLVYPLAKGADVANGRRECLKRRILLPQRRVGDDTGRLRQTHPMTMKYLESHEEAFLRRKSSIYRDRDRFALFGIGPYTFAPWKVAICGLYKHLTFTVFGPIEDRPVVFDDTSYFLSFKSRRQADLARQLLTSGPASRFFQARVFWDAKRPITAELLGRLDLAAVARELRMEDEFEREIGLVK